MKVRNKLETHPHIKFNDIQIGDVIMFPDTEGWRHHVLMRVWANKGYNKSNRELDSFKLVRLDDGHPTSTRSPAGETYTITREMMERGVTAANCPTKYYHAIRYNASITLENKS